MKECALKKALKKFHTNMVNDEVGSGGRRLGGRVKNSGKMSRGGSKSRMIVWLICP